MTHPFATDEADYLRLCRAAERALMTWDAYRLSSISENYVALCEVMRALSDAMDAHDSAVAPVPPAATAAVPTSPPPQDPPDPHAAQEASGGAEGG